MLWSSSEIQALLYINCVKKENVSRVKMHSFELMKILINMTMFYEKRNSEYFELKIECTLNNESNIITKLDS